MNKDKWIEYYTSIFLDAGIDITKYTNEEKEVVIKGLVAPQICEQSNITEKWMFEMFWEALMLTELNIELTGSVDASMFKNRANQSKN